MRSIFRYGNGNDDNDDGDKVGIIKYDYVGYKEKYNEWNKYQNEILELVRL